MSGVAELLGQRLQYVLWILAYRLEKGPGRAGRGAATLLPVAQCADMDLDDTGGVPVAGVVD